MPSFNPTNVRGYDRLRPVALLLCAAALVTCSGRDYDVIIENARLVDGTGNPWMYGDVAIKGDRIAAITPLGALKDKSARQRIDAKHHVVAPGFIDIQNHSWEPVLWQDGRVISMTTQGVTSVILGEATTPAPSNAKIEELVGLPKMAARRAELQRQFRGANGFANWLHAIDKHANSVNAGSYLGATTVRAYAMGQKAGPPSPSEVDTMRTVVRNAMHDGAFGISSALIYPPGSYAGTAELIEMAKAMAPYHGAYITHLRSEGDSLFEAMDEAFRIAREGGVQLDIYHLKAASRRNWSKAAGMIAKIDSARAAGLDVGATMYPYAYSGNNLASCIPEWASENGKLFANLRDSTIRARILHDMADPKGESLCQMEGPTNYMIADLRKPENAKYEGKYLNEIAGDMHLPWPDAVVALMLSENRDPSKINFSMSEDNVRLQIVRPWVVIGTDAGGFDPDSTKRTVHPRSYGTYPRILGRYVREDKLLTLEDAVRKMTGAVAARLGLRDRGLLREGMFADIVVFDDATIIDLSTPEKPHQLSRGVEQLFVNGVQVIRDGRHTGATPGRALRRQ